VVNWAIATRLVSVLAGAAMAVAAVACGGDGAATPACGAAVEEALDPGSARHVLPGAPEPAYATDPPTSGAHHPGAQARGVSRSPLPRPEQVAVLEAGGVVLQHRGLADGDRRRLEAVAGPDVVVAPNEGLDAPVVATAWRHSMRCTEVDAAALAAFVDAYRGRGPEAGSR